MADETHSRFATVSHLQFKIIVVGHTTKRMTHSRSWSPSVTFSTEDRHNFHVPLTTVRLLLNVRPSTRSSVCLTNGDREPTPPFYGHYTGQPALAGTSSWELEAFVGAKFYCPHAFADGNQRIRIREKTLKFSSTVPTSSAYPRDWSSNEKWNTRHSCFTC